MADQDPDVIKLLQAIADGSFKGDGQFWDRAAESMIAASKAFLALSPEEMQRLHDDPSALNRFVVEFSARTKNETQES